MKATIWLSLLLTTLLTGCDFQEGFWRRSPTNTFQGYSVDGRFFLLNTTSGEVSEYRDGKLHRVLTDTSKPVRLLPGALYLDEQGGQLVYDGSMKLRAVPLQLPPGWTMENAKADTPQANPPPKEEGQVGDKRMVGEKEFTKTPEGWVLTKVGRFEIIEVK